MQQLVDTHCHIHEIAGDTGEDEALHALWQKAGITDPDKVAMEARKAGVDTLICVGTTLGDSKLAVDFVRERENLWAAIGIHPHEAKGYKDQKKLQEFADLANKPKVVAIGECGLDYYYNHSPKEEQIEIFRFQLELAQKHQLPLIFHVRDAQQPTNAAAKSVWQDFFGALDEFPGVRGVVHSFTANKVILGECLQRGLYIGLNGIMTFTKDEEQLAAARAVPLQKLLLETDAPFLTPSPYRGTICEPKHIAVTAEFLSELRGESVTELAQATTHNAKELFNLSLN